MGFDATSAVLNDLVGKRHIVALLALLPWFVRLRRSHSQSEKDFCCGVRALLAGKSVEGKDSRVFEVKLW